MRDQLRGVLTLALASAAIGGPAASARQSPAATSVFVDDFSGAAFDRTKWNVIVTGRTVNNEQQAYVDSTDTIFVARGADAEGASNGALVIQPRWHQGTRAVSERASASEPRARSGDSGGPASARVGGPGAQPPDQGRSFDFTSGRLESQGKVEFTHGLVSARIKLTAGDGLWPAFWTLGNGRWPDSGEMDIMENVGDRTWTNVALHGPGYSGNTPLVKRRAFPAGTEITGWHVYSMEWTTRGFAFKVDDDEFYRVTRADVEQYGRWAYDTPKYLILNFALGGNYPHGVNHVESPYPGIPTSTVDLIKAGRAKMVVDWVKVEKR